MGLTRPGAKFKPHPEQVCAVSLNLSFITPKTVTSETAGAEPSPCSHQSLLAGTEGRRLGFRGGRGLVCLQKFELLVWSKD